MNLENGMSAIERLNLARFLERRDPPPLTPAARQKAEEAGITAIARKE